MMQRCRVPPVATETKEGGQEVHEAGTSQVDPSTPTLVLSLKWACVQLLWGTLFAKSALLS